MWGLGFRVQGLGVQGFGLQEFVALAPGAAASSTYARPEESDIADMGPYTVLLL